MEKNYDFARERVRLAMKQTTDEDIKKEFRKQFISSNLHGSIIAISCGKIDVDLSAYTSEDGMNPKFFDYKEWVANCT